MRRGNPHGAVAGDDRGDERGRKVTAGTMASYVLEEPASASNFDERAYLAANPDVARAVAAGQFESGRQHFAAFGRREG
jgi:hypothetical protein